MKERIAELKKEMEGIAKEISIIDKSRGNLIRRLVEKEGAIKELTKLLQEGDKP